MKIWSQRSAAPIVEPVMMQARMVLDAAPGKMRRRRVAEWLQEFMRHVEVALIATRHRKPGARAEMVRIRNRYSSSYASLVRQFVANAGRDVDPQTFLRRPDHAGDLARRLVLAHAAMRAMSEVLMHWGRLCNEAAEDKGPTIEALRQPQRQDSIVRMFHRGDITESQLRAAREIAWIFESVTSALSTRAMQIEFAGRPPKGSYRGSGIGDRAAMLHSARYMPWASRCHSTGLNFDLVIDVVVFGVSVRAASAGKMDYARLKRQVVRALEVYEEICGARALTIPDHFCAS